MGVHPCVRLTRCDSSPSGLWHPPSIRRLFHPARLGPFVPPQYPGTVAAATCHPSSGARNLGLVQETTSDGIGYRRSSARLCGQGSFGEKSTTAPRTWSNERTACPQETNLAGEGVELAYPKWRMYGGEGSHPRRPRDRTVGAAAVCCRRHFRGIMKPFGCV
jgi:hypothetical protein